MVSEPPPRHSKNAPEPVTIELEAQPAPPADGDAARPSDSASDPASATTAETSAADSVPGGPEAAVEAGSDTGKDAGHDADPNRPDEPGMMSDATEAPAATESAATTRDALSGNPPPRRSSALVSGLVGGLVALAGVGVLGFAGLLPTGGGTAALIDSDKAMEARIRALTVRLDELVIPPPADLAPIETRLAALEKTLDALPGGAPGSDQGARIAALSDEAAGLKAALATARADAEKAAAALSMRIEALEKKSQEPRDDVEVARAIASAGLKAAIDRGGTFMSELETLAGIAKDDPAIAELRNFAATGVPSRADLLAAYPDAASAMIAAVKVSDPNQSWWDRLTASASSLVKVRPVGTVEGEGPDAIIARMEVNLANGDLKAVALEWAGLPEPAKAAGQAFKTRLDARIRVEELVGGTLGRAVTGTVTGG